MRPTAIIPVRFLQEELRQAFAKFYPGDTAEALAIMHTQMHAKFARSLGELPVSEGDVRKSIRRATVSARFKVASPNLIVADPIRGESGAVKEVLEQEILDCIESLGGHVTNAQIRAALPDLQLSETMCRRTLGSLERAGRIATVGRGARGVRFFSIAEPDESVGAAAVEARFEHRKAD